MIPRQKHSKRAVPDGEKLDWRAQYLSNLLDIQPGIPTEADPVGLSEGNKKTGVSGTLYSSVFVWNLPAVATCPGASEWCLRCCYNADDRADVFPVEEWRRNWSWLESDAPCVRTRILAQLSQAKLPSAVRIHSSGDFYSPEYIRFWRSIVQAAPGTSFWAYTRSWRKENLLSILEELRAEPNVQLFASWDETMPDPPSGWRVSVVIDPPDQQSVHQPSLVCPEQTGALPNCASCGYCIKPRKGHVLFHLH
jgi:Gene product 88